jgi:3-oxoacyl-[acyl-carrier-protein] synthase-3
MRSMGDAIGILGTGHFLPGEPVTADRVEEVLGPVRGLSPRVAARVARLQAEMISRGGIKHRHYALEGTTRRQTETNVSMMEKAARAAFAAAQVEPASVDLLVCAGPMSDYACPPTSVLLQEALGITRCTEIEVHSNCTGTPKGLQIVIDMLRAGRHRRAVFAYAQLSSMFLRSEFFNPEHVGLDNLALRWMLSDGAGAMVLDREGAALRLVDAYVESVGVGREPGMVGGASGALGHAVGLDGLPFYPALHAAGAHHVRQDIADVARHAPYDLIDGLGRMLGAHGVAGDDVSHFLVGIPGRHFMTDEVRAHFVKEVGTDSHRVPFDIDEFGYCGGATMLIQFDRLVRSGRLTQGELVAAYLEESSKWMSGGFLATA